MIGCSLLHHAILTDLLTDSEVWDDAELDENENDF